MAGGWQVPRARAYPLCGLGQVRVVPLPNFSEVIVSDLKLAQAALAIVRAVRDSRKWPEGVAIERLAEAYRLADRFEIDRMRRRWKKQDKELTSALAD